MREVFESGVGNMKDRSKYFILWTSSICISGSAVAAFLHSIGWLFVCVVTISGVSFVALIAAGVPSAQEWLKFRAAERTQRALRRPVSSIWNKWRYTTDGFEAGQMSTTLRKSPAIPGAAMAGYEKWPSVTVGIIVACESLGVLPETSDLRDGFIKLLDENSVSKIVACIVPDANELHWTSYSSNGRISNAAVFARENGDPLDARAWALLVLREGTVSPQGQTPQYGELLLHIDLRFESGAPAPPLSFASWHRMLIDIMSLAYKFANFLSDDLGVSIYNEPPTQVGICFNAPGNVDEIFDCEHLDRVAGSPQLRSYPCYLISTRSGVSESNAAWDLLRSVADHALHLHGYEVKIQGLGRS